MVDGWLNLIKFVTSQFGLPGSLAVGIAGYLIWLLKQERDAHSKTRDKIDEINEKRIQLQEIYVNAMRDLKEALQAIQAAIGKNHG